MDWLVVSSEHFDKKTGKYNIPEKRINSICQELKKNPYVGKQLSYKFLREKKYDNKRIYYLVYDDLKLVMLVSVSDKKTQNEIIKTIKDSFEEFKKVAEEIAKKVRKN